MTIVVLRVVAVAFLLAGCGQPDAAMCPPASDQDDTTRGGDPGPLSEPSTSLRSAQDCLRREAYREAGSSRSDQYAAQAVLRRCADQVAIASGRAAAAEEPVGRIDEQFNLVERPRLMAEERRKLLRFALDRVNEKRSGVCR